MATVNNLLQETAYNHMHMIHTSHLGKKKKGISFSGTFFQKRELAGVFYYYCETYGFLFQNSYNHRLYGEWNVTVGIWHYNYPIKHCKFWLLCIDFIAKVHSTVLKGYWNSTRAFQAMETMGGGGEGGGGGGGEDILFGPSLNM